MEQTEFISDKNISQKKRGLCFVQSPLCVTVNLSFSSLAIFSWPPDSAVPGVLPDVYGSVPAWKQVPDVLPESSHGYGFGVSQSVPGYVHVLCAVLLKFIDMQLNSVQDLIFVQSTKGMPVFEMLPETFVG